MDPESVVIFIFSFIFFLSFFLNSLCLLDCFCSVAFVFNKFLLGVFKPLQFKKKNKQTLRWLNRAFLSPIMRSSRTHCRNFVVRPRTRYGHWIQYRFVRSGVAVSSLPSRPVTCDQGRQFGPGGRPKEARPRKVNPRYTGGNWVQ